MAPDWTQAEFSGPCWVDYELPLKHLRSCRQRPDELPRPDDLQSLLPASVITRSGFPVRFVPGESIPGVAYEEHIFETGEVSTRRDCWHDLFNALVWVRFPFIKAAMNAAHFEQIQNQAGTQRGPRRDALTLFDECGVIVASHCAPLLNALARHDWKLAFNEHAGSWQEETFVLVCGHAMLEKFLDPYKAMTAQSLLLQLNASQARLERRKLVEVLDQGLATSIGEGKMLQSSQDLSPLPLAGIPGWWLSEPQDENFYADRRVFRPLPAGKQAGRIFDARSYQASP